MADLRVLSGPLILNPRTDRRCSLHPRPRANDLACPSFINHLFSRYPQHLERCQRACVPSPAGFRQPRANMAPFYFLVYNTIRQLYQASINPIYLSRRS